MILLVGLGNPGKKYKDTRHNIGFRIVDKFKEINNFSEFRLSKKFNSLVSEGLVDSKKVILAEPQTFMNKSGEAIKTLINFYKSTGSVPATKPNLVVVHDDIDLPLGKIKIVKSRGAAGHKGVESIIKEIGTKDFIRFRIGIQSIKAKPRSDESRLYYGARPKNAERFVLQKFKKEEEKIMKEIIKKATEAIKLIFEKGLEKTMNKYNK